MSSLAETLTTPYYAAILETKPHLAMDEPANDTDRLVTLAVRRPGFLGLETTRAEDGRPLTVAYWRDLADVEGWTREGAGSTEKKFPLEICRIANSADGALHGLVAASKGSADAAPR